MFYLTLKIMKRKLLGKLFFMSRLLFFSLAITAFFSGYLFATEGVSQGITVTGKVLSGEDDSELPGVNIVVQGTSVGTVTDVEGNYSLDVPDENSVLIFSSVGFVTEEVMVGNQTVVNMTLLPDITALSEIVVLGYTTASKKDVASAISTVAGKDLEGLAISDIRQTLQGKVAGVQVINNSGDPGAGAKVLIRGMGSFSNPDPLYVIDGIQGGDINSVQPQDIESMTVLKDASTTAIYGSAAANGVVIITTKGGKTGAPVVSYDGSVGLAQVNKRYDMLNASDYVDLVDDIQAAGGLELSEKLQGSDVRIDRTDWQESIFRNALITDHSLRVSGGTEKVSYAMSGGYINNESTILDRNFQRFTFGAKLDEKVGIFKFTQGIRVKYDKNKGVLANFNDALRMPPYIEIYDPTNLGGYGRADKVTDLNDSNNPYNAVYNSDFESTDLNLNIELAGEVEIYKGLSFKSQARIGAGNYHNYEWNYPSNGGNFARTTSDIRESYRVHSNFLWENFFNYNNTFGDHTLNVVLGNTYAPSGSFRQVGVAGADYTSDAIKNVALANTNSVINAYVNSGKSRLSYFGRVGYTFKDKYVVNASVRRDGSSVFGSENRWGTFYGVGTAWTISEEAFMANMSAISDLKIRASYGTTGNDNIPAFLTSPTVWKGWSNNVAYSFGDDLSFATGSIVNSIPNPFLKWEETTQWDIGVDIGFFDNKLNLVFDYYSRSNEDLLINTKLANSTGLGGPSADPSQWVNAAAMLNKGFESAVTYRKSDGEFQWDVTFNATYSSNEVTALGTLGDTPISDGEWVAGVGNSTRTDIGHPLGSYFGYQVDHVAVDQAEVNRLNDAAAAASGGEVTEYQANMLPGDFVFKDVDGNGYIDPEDRDYIGNPAPTWQYGGFFNAKWKGFDFQLQAFGLADVSVVNGGRYWWEGMSKPFNSTTTTLRRWRNEGDVTDIPAAAQNSGSNLAFSDWYVESGAYFRIRNITLGYTIPQDMFNNTIKTLRLYLAVQNALTVTNYSGYDPEISTYAPEDNNVYIFERGIDRYQRPNPIIYRIGVQLSF